MLKRVKRKLVSVAMGIGLTACGPSAPATDDLGALVFSDTFESDGALKNYTTHNGAALETVQAKDGRYYAPILDNPNNITLHFNQDQGRLDAQLTSFPFNVVVRNIGVGTLNDTQVAPPHGKDTYIFAGVQVHAQDPEARTSSHVVVGHRARHFNTVEGKNTPDGKSFVNDVGTDKAHKGRADLLIQGLADRTLKVFWQKPNLQHPTKPDQWIPYNKLGELPGDDPRFGDKVFVGLITYAYGDEGLPFVGTADSWSLYTPHPK